MREYIKHKTSSSSSRVEERRRETRCDNVRIIGRWQTQIFHRQKSTENLEIKRVRPVDAKNANRKFSVVRRIFAPDIKSLWSRRMSWIERSFVVVNLQMMLIGNIQSITGREIYFIAAWFPDSSNDFFSSLKWLQAKCFYDFRKKAGIEWTMKNGFKWASASSRTHGQARSKNENMKLVHTQFNFRAWKMDSRGNWHHESHVQELAAQLRFEIFFRSISRRRDVQRLRRGQSNPNHSIIVFFVWDLACRLLARHLSTECEIEEIVYSIGYITKQLLPITSDEKQCPAYSISQSQVAIFVSTAAAF